MKGLNRSELNRCLEMKTEKECYRIDTLYPLLQECIADEEMSGVEMRQSVEEIVHGEGDEVLVLKKNHLVALPPYTMFSRVLLLTRRVVILRGKIVSPEGEISVIVALCAARQD